MNFELTEVMKEYRPEHERMLWSLPATGSAFKKVYYDPNLGRQVSMFVPAEDIILPYGTTDMDTCRRLTHVMRKTKNEIVKLQASGLLPRRRTGRCPTRTSPTSSRPRTKRRASVTSTTTASRSDGGAR
jgi:hypothetical protein